MKSGNIQVKRIMSFVLLGIILFYSSCKKDDETLPLAEIPVIGSVTPETGTINTEITITGSNFKEGAMVFIGETASAGIEVASGTVLYAKIPSGIPANTLLPVTVRNQGGGEAVLNNAFKAIDPVLSYINSATKPSGNSGSTVILEGNAFGDLQGEGEILFSDGAGGTVAASVSSPEDWTDEFIVTTVPSGAKDGPVVIETETGISSEIFFKVTDAAIFSPSAINWTETTSLPVAVSGHKALSISIDDENNATSQFVMVSGGRDGEGIASDQVYSGLISTTGTISSWNSLSSLPDSVSFHAKVGATPYNSKVDGDGFIFVLGGINGRGETLPAVSVAGLNSDGTLQGWSSSRALPEALHSAGAVIFRSAIYVAGGADGDNNPLSKVYKANIKPDGQLDEWELMSELPMGIAHHGFVSFGGYLYSVGGETGVTTPDAGTNVTGNSQIFYSKINLRTGEIGSWTENPTSIGKERSKHSTLILGGSIFISSGLYSGLGGNTGGSSENSYAGINSDGTINSFSGATGSNTLYNNTGSNLFNQAGISYIDPDGVAHVLIIGGAKVGSPEVKLANVIYY